MARWSRRRRGPAFAGAALLLLLAARASAAQDGPLWPDREEIEHFLKKAKVTARKKIGVGVTNPEKVTLELDGAVRHAVFKKIDEPLDNWRNEVAAYELDKLLSPRSQCHDEQDSSLPGHPDGHATLGDDRVAYEQVVEIQKDRHCLFKCDAVLGDVRVRLLRVSLEVPEGNRRHVPQIVAPHPAWRPWPQACGLEDCVGL